MPLRRFAVTETAVVVILRVCENNEEHNERPLEASVPSGQDERDPLGVDLAACRQRLAEFRWEFYRSLTRWADALFELTDAVLCADGPVDSLVGLSLVAEHRRGHGALYDAVNHGRLEPAWA